MQDNVFGLAVIAKATFEQSGDGGLQQTQDNPWPVHLQPLETPHGVFPPEATPYPKPRTDVIVCGRARTPGANPLTSMDVSVSVGESRLVIRVFGDRTWQRDGGKWEPTDPEPFTEMPLDAEHAFGGVLENEWGELGNPVNPKGKGWYIYEDQAEGGPLPNLEDPDDRMTSPTQNPEPVAPCVWPAAGAFLAAGGKLMERKRFPSRQEMDHLIHCWAHPRLMLERVVQAGEMLTVDGVCEDGPLAFTVPSFEGAGEVVCGQEHTQIPFKLDTLIVLADQRRLVCRWRGAGTFEIRPRQKRQIFLRAAEEKGA